MSVGSLRGRLLVGLLAPLVTIALIAGLARYGLAVMLSERLYDDALTVAALAIGRDAVLSEGDMPEDAFRARLGAALGADLFHRVLGPDGRFVAGYADAPRPPAPLGPEPRHWSAVLDGAPVRVVGFTERLGDPDGGDGEVQVVVWQSVERREGLSLELLAQAAALLLTLGLTAVAAVWVGVGRALAPLTALRAAVARRNPDDLSPIDAPAPTEVRPLVAALDALLARLRDAFAARDALISDAAHQLRNPVAAIQAQAESALAADPDEMRRRVEGLAVAARRASRLTEQLLSLERARGALAQPERFDLAAMAADVARARAPRALRHGVEIALSAEAPVMVTGDRAMLEEAVDNLIDNALRHGRRDGGAVEITVRATPDGASLTVADDGPGVTDGDRATIFERFGRGAAAGAGGSGLGLPIARAVVERHGGALRLLPGGPGAVFEIRLPSS